MAADIFYREEVKQLVGRVCTKRLSGAGSLGNLKEVREIE
jgi:hypothetical protein